MRHLVVLISIIIFSTDTHSQELYVFSEPASSLPAHALSVKFKNHFTGKNEFFDRLSYRVAPQVFMGLSKNMTLRMGSTFSNMYTYNPKLESANFYLKVRFLSSDAVHRHFRMAGFLEAAKTSSPFHFDEINLGGDRSGVEAGLILTQLWHKLAVSATVSHTQVIDSYRWDKGAHAGRHAFQSLQSVISAGYLLFPRTYTSYKQTNLNVYLELITQRLLDQNRYYVDVAPALQLIFSSQTKLNLGYRVQLGSDMERMMRRYWLLSVETTFLGALKKK
ncbi:MAG: hypothetical protein EBR98_00390 [Chitinophagaceae bacterium]|jgi:hypothetical protein|nr:hypothetical protein [Chitinophagaceae bacterium]